MITDLEIANFQSHKSTALSFSPGTNVILGHSDVGKSSIIRAIHWAVANRPSGDSFRANFTKDPTEVAIAFGDDFISRKKGKSFNGYSTGQGDFKALRTDVPQAVQETTKMEEVNIQPQYKSYFLLDETPGNVAKAFNSVSGLEEMDTALKNINSKVRSTSAEVTSNVKRSAELEEMIDAFSWIEKAEDALQRISELKVSLEQLAVSVQRIKNVLSDIRSCEIAYSELPDFSALPYINDIFDLDSKIDQQLEHHNKLSLLLTDLSIHKNKQKRYIALDREALSTADEISQRIATITSTIFFVYSKSEAIEERQHMRKRNEIEIAEYRQIYDKMYQTLQVCPQCGQAIEITKVDKL